MPWILIKFEKDGSIEVVPFSWVIFDDKEISVFYPPGPYDDETNKAAIRKKIQKLENFDLEWDAYAVELKGRASKDFFLFSYVLLV